MLYAEYRTRHKFNGISIEYFIVHRKYSVGVLHLRDNTRKLIIANTF